MGTLHFFLINLITPSFDSPFYLIQFFTIFHKWGWVMYIDSPNNWPCVNHTLKNSMESIDNNLVLLLNSPMSIDKNPSLLSSRLMLVSSLNFKYSLVITNEMTKSLVPPMDCMKFCTINTKLPMKSRNVS
jgi:hypothetical protein